MISPTGTVSGESPEVAAKRFYDWYVNHPDPLKSGEYLKNDDITEEYKNIMGRYVRRGIEGGRDPVFNCGDTVLPKNVTTLTPEYSEDGMLSIVIINEASTGRDLFQIKLAKVGGNWLVRDVWCAPFEETE
jgi:hypothetical protein